MRRMCLLVVLLVAVVSPTAAQVAINPSSLAAPVIVFPASAVNGGGTVTSPQLLLPDGTAALPAAAFASAPTTGMYLAGTALAFSRLNSQQMQLSGSGQLDILVDTATLRMGASTDTTFGRISAGVVKVANGTAASTAEFQVSGGNGGFISSVKALTELTTIAAAATTNTVIQIPVNAVVLAVSVRVVTIIPTAATFTVTSATPAKTWNTAAVTVAAGSTDPGTAPGPTFQTTASVITITPNLTPGTATGQVRVTIFYYQVTPPTS